MRGSFFIYAWKRKKDTKPQFNILEDAYALIMIGNTTWGRSLTVLF